MGARMGKADIGNGPISGTHGHIAEMRGSPGTVSQLRSLCLLAPPPEAKRQSWGESHPLQQRKVLRIALDEVTAPAEALLKGVRVREGDAVEGANLDVPPRPTAGEAVQRLQQSQILKTLRARRVAHARHRDGGGQRVEATVKLDGEG